MVVMEQEKHIIEEIFSNLKKMYYSGNIPGIRHYLYRNREKFSSNPKLHICVMECLSSVICNKRYNKRDRLALYNIIHENNLWRTRKGIPEINPVMNSLLFMGFKYVFEFFYQHVSNANDDKRKINLTQIYISEFVNTIMDRNDFYENTYFQIIAKICLKYSEEGDATSTIHDLGVRFSLKKTDFNFLYQKGTIDNDLKGFFKIFGCDRDKFLEFSQSECFEKYKYNRYLCNDIGQYGYYVKDVHDRIYGLSVEDFKKIAGYVIMRDSINNVGKTVSYMLQNKKDIPLILNNFKRV